MTQMDSNKSTNPLTARDEAARAEIAELKPCLCVLAFVSAELGYCVLAPGTTRSADARHGPRRRVR